jgi:hypothetical protein
MEGLKVGDWAGAVNDAIGGETCVNHTAVKAVSNKRHRDGIWDGQAILGQIYGYEIENRTIKEAEHERVTERGSYVGGAIIWNERRRPSPLRENPFPGPTTPSGLNHMSDS